MISEVLTHPLACKRRSELVKASKSAADLTERWWGYSSCTLDCANTALITDAKCTWRIRATSPAEPIRGHLPNYYSITAPWSELNEELNSFFFSSVFLSYSPKIHVYLNVTRNFTCERVLWNDSVCARVCVCVYSCRSAGYCRSFRHL